MSFAKLDSSIVFSTVWREALHVRVVWITMLALKDRLGVVEASIPGLADAAQVTLEQCEESLQRLSAPDPYSRTKDHEGRRIAEVPGGWFVINHEKYRGKPDEDERREQIRQAVARHRERKKAGGDGAGDVIPVINVISDDYSNHIISDQSISETDKNKSLTTLGASPLVADFPTAWNLYPKRTGGNSKADALKCWNARIKQGVKPADLLAGIQRYAAFCEATGKTGTEFVKQARTFLGPAQHWTETWDIPPAVRHTLTKTERGREALQRFLDRGQENGNRASSSGDAGPVPRALPKPRPD